MTETTTPNNDSSRLHYIDTPDDIAAVWISDIDGEPSAHLEALRSGAEPPSPAFLIADAVKHPEGWIVTTRYPEETPPSEPIQRRFDAKRLLRLTVRVALA